MKEVIAWYTRCSCIYCSLLSSALSARRPREQSLTWLRAERLEAEGQLEAAAAQYRRILRLAPRSIPALNALGALSVRQGKAREGISYYDQALKIDPREFGTNLNLGSLGLLPITQAGKKALTCPTVKCQLAVGPLE